VFAQFGVPAYSMLTKLTVAFAVNGAVVNDPKPFASMLIVAATPLKVYLTTVFGVASTLIVTGLPVQTVLGTLKATTTGAVNTVKA
jgi:hypothetical protein